MYRNIWNGRRAFSGKDGICRSDAEITYEGPVQGKKRIGTALAALQEPGKRCRFWAIGHDCRVLWGRLRGCLPPADNRTSHRPGSTGRSWRHWRRIYTDPACLMRNLWHCPFQIGESGIRRLMAKAESFHRHGIAGWWRRQKADTGNRCCGSEGLTDTESPAAAKRVFHQTRNCRLRRNRIF